MAARRNAVNSFNDSNASMCFALPCARLALEGMHAHAQSSCPAGGGGRVEHMRAEGGEREVLTARQSDASQWRRSERRGHRAAQCPIQNDNVEPPATANLLGVEAVP